MKALISTPRGTVFDTFFPPENIQLAESLGDIVWNPEDSQFTKEELFPLLRDCDAYITTWGAPRLDGDLIAACPRLKLLTHLCGTVKPVTSDAVWENGIRVLTGNNYFAESVAEGTLAYILSALRDIPYYSHRLNTSISGKLPPMKTAVLPERKSVFSVTVRSRVTSSVFSPISAWRCLYTISSRSLRRISRVIS